MPEMFQGVLMGFAIFTIFQASIEIWMKRRDKRRYRKVEFKPSPKPPVLPTQNRQRTSAPKANDKARVTQRRVIGKPRRKF